MTARSDAEIRAELSPGVIAAMDALAEKAAHWQEWAEALREKFQAEARVTNDLTRRILDVEDERDRLAATLRRVEKLCDLDVPVAHAGRWAYRMGWDGLSARIRAALAEDNSGDTE